MSSNADETAEITLGGQVFRVDAFTLDQLQELGEPLDIISGGGGLAKKLPALKQVIAIAAGKKPEELGPLKTNLVEVYDALKKVMKVTGVEELKNRASPATTPGA